MFSAGGSAIENSTKHPLGQEALKARRRPKRFMIFDQADSPVPKRRMEYVNERLQSFHITPQPVNFVSSTSRGSKETANVEIMMEDSAIKIEELPYNSENCHQESSQTVNECDIEEPSLSLCAELQKYLTRARNENLVLQNSQKHQESALTIYRNPYAHYRIQDVTDSDSSLFAQDASEQQPIVSFPDEMNGSIEIDLECSESNSEHACFEEQMELDE